MYVILSNYLEELYESFKQNLYFPGDTLTLERLVVVPNSAIRDWLQQRLANDPDIGICAGIKFAFEDDAFARLALPSGISLPSHMQISFALEADITQLLQHSTNDPVWNPLFDYLKSTPGTLPSLKTQRRLVALCEKLATLFRDYGKQAGRLIASWPLYAPDWQQRLWQRLYASHLHWSYPYRQEDPPSFVPSRRVYLFGQIYLCPLYHRFFLKLAQQCPVKAYLFSACAEYWADIRSDRESAQLLRYHRKQGVSVSQQEALEELLRDRNSLLANIGKVGRKMAVQLDWEQQELDSCYQIPQQASLLAQVQKDLLHLHNPTQGLPADASVQIHIAPTRLREVEALYDILCALMQEHTIAPSEIQVLAPDIEPYVPLIKAVFNTDPKIHYHLADLSVFSHDPYTDGFRRLLDLAQSRWEAPMVLEFIECPPMRQRYNFSDADLLTIRNWVQQAGILWGNSPLHRSELLKKSHCLQEPVSEHPAGTWKEGLGRLLNGLIYGHDNIGTETLPISTINWSDTPLLTQFIGLIQNLQEELIPLHDGTKKTPADWISYLLKLCHNHLSGNSERLLPILTEISAASPLAVPFTSIHTRLERQLETKRYTQRDVEGQAIRFGSIRSSSGIPAKVVCLIGLDEGAFPLSQTASPLNLLVKQELVDDLPSPVEQDRQRFLDALLSARSYLICSYTELNRNDGREQNPSTLLMEFLTFLQRSYGIPAHQITTRHPFYPFDKTYFSQPNTHPKAWYQAAQAHYGTKKESPHNFFNDFSLINKLGPQELTIDLKVLETAAKNPLKLYCNQALGLYLKEDKTLRADEPFVLNSLDRYQIKEESKEKSLEIALKHASAQTMLPQGLFGEVASQRVREDFAMVLGQVNPDQLFSVEFGLNTKEPIQYSSNHWLLPAIPVQIESKTVFIHGCLTNLSPLGWLFNGRGELADKIKAWPGSLLLTHIPEEIFPNRTILWAKNAKSTPVVQDSVNHLTTFVQYALNCQQNPSPLMPEWIADIIIGDTEKIRKTSEGEYFFNPYALWGCKNMEQALSNQALSHWATTAQQVYRLDQLIS